MRLGVFISILVTVVAALPAHAVTIHWGNSLFDSLKQSDGFTPINAAEFTVQLGHFDGLDPIETNIDQWQSSWKVFDQANFNSAIGYFTGSANVASDRTSDSLAADPATLFPVGEQAYMWISNGGMANDPDTEWTVLTNASWVYPEGQHDQVEWRVSDAGTMAVFGVYESEDGLGVYIAPTSGPVTIQAATFPIPEPSTTCLLVAGLGYLIVGRRKRTATANLMS